MKGVRFAPSPTGDFHLGNLRTAWISHEWARRLGEPWVVRFEDIDRPRVVPGALDRQIADMKTLGLEIDELHLQSERLPRHEELFVRAVKDARIYACDCSRKKAAEALARIASAPHERPPLYAGTCRGKGIQPGPGVAWRFAMPDDGRQDFVVARTGDVGEFLPSYNWACAIDDADGRYTLLVRAHDLSHVLEQQRAIQQWVLGRGDELPAVFHTSLVVRDDGGRLEKRTLGVTLHELLAKGLDAHAVLERFRSSFHCDFARPAPGEILGEAAERINLSALGF